MPGKTSTRQKCQRDKECGRRPVPPKAIQQRNQEPSTQAHNEDIEGVKEAAYHLEFAKASIDSVFLAA